MSPDLHAAVVRQRIGPSERAVQIHSVLDAAGVLGKLRRRGDRLVGPCPLHGGDNTTAFTVDLRLNRWYCFTNCSAGGDVVDLVRRLHRVGFPEAATILRGLSSSTPLPSAAAIARLPKPITEFRPFRRSLALNHYSPLLQAKGITAATARAHEVGAYEAEGWLKDCIGVRLHDPAGAPLGYLGRSLLPTSFSRWKVPPAFPKGRILYNYHRALNARMDTIAVTECPWGVLRLAQLGIPAVALLGLQVSDLQHDLLTRFLQIVLLLDGDPAGRSAADRIGETLRRTTPTTISRLPDGLDPDDVGDGTLQALLQPFFPY